MKVVGNCRFKQFGVDVRTPCTLGRTFLGGDSKIFLEQGISAGYPFLNTLSPKSCYTNICQYLSCMRLPLGRPKGGNKTTGSISLKLHVQYFELEYICDKLFQKYLKNDNQYYGHQL